MLTSGPISLAKKTVGEDHGHCSVVAFKLSFHSINGTPMQQGLETKDPGLSEVNYRDNFCKETSSLHKNSLLIYHYILKVSSKTHVEI